MTDDLTPPHWGSAEIEDQMTDDELRGWLSDGPSHGIHINSNTLNAICNAALTARAALPLSAALALPEVAALVEALRFVDFTFRELGWHSKWEQTSAALSALDAAKGGE